MLIEDLFWDTGAVSVTVIDAEDQPIYEPGPGEEPVWENVIVTGLFADDLDIDGVRWSLCLRPGSEVLFVEVGG